MKALLRFTKPIVLSSLLATIGLSVAVNTAPNAMAASPNFTATGRGGDVLTIGNSFPAGATIRLQILDSSSNAVTTQNITASSGGSSPGFFETAIKTGYAGAATVTASQDVCTLIGWGGIPPRPRFSCHYVLLASEKTTIYPAPHIDGTAYAGGVLVGGSGFTPGATERFEVIDPSWHVLATDYETAYYGVPAVYDGTADAWLQTGSYTGWAYVVADGLPQESNWMKVYVHP
jgi:hypothetical protein